MAKLRLLESYVGSSFLYFFLVTKVIQSLFLRFFPPTVIKNLLTPTPHPQSTMNSSMDNWFRRRLAGQYLADANPRIRNSDDFLDIYSNRIENSFNMEVAYQGNNFIYSP